MYVGAYMGLGAASSAAQEVDQLNIELVNVYLKLNQRFLDTPWWNKQVKGQIQTAIFVLNDTVMTTFGRLAPQAKAGDAEALSRIRHVASTALKGMSDIIQELDTATAANLKQLAADIDEDLRKTTAKVASAAAGGASVALWEMLKNAPFITIGAGVLLTAWAYGRLKK